MRRGHRNSRVYLAGPLFTQAERRWNAELASRLRSMGYDVIVPQESAQKMLEDAGAFSARELFSNAVRSIDECDVLVAILDGSDADSGTCWECGYAWNATRPIIGVRTDLRLGGDDSERAVNLMLSLSCNEFVRIEPAEMEVEKVATLLGEAIRKHVQR